MNIFLKRHNRPIKNRLKSITTLCIVNVFCKSKPSFESILVLMYLREIICQW